jgi:hypothetical protein
MNDPLQIATKAVQLYAEMHPRPVQVNQGQAAQMLGVSRPTVTRLIEVGTLTLNDCGMIPTYQIDLALGGRKRL